MGVVFVLSVMKGVLFKMKKQIQKYQKFLEEELKKVEEKRNYEYGKWLLDFHIQKMENFKHERLIHLLVTFFFGFLLAALLFLSLFYGQALLEDGFSSLFLFYTLTLIVLVVEGFYINHYYFLENNIQKLYVEEEKLYMFLKKWSEDKV